MKVLWDLKTVRRALPVYAACVALVGLLIWGTRNHSWRNEHKSLAEAIASNIRGQKTAGETMQEIIDARRTWTPVLLDWYGRRAPDWTFQDSDGIDHRLREWHGRPVVLMFWATWSPAGFVQAGHLDRLAEETGQDGPVIVAISEEAVDKLEAFATLHKVHFKLASFRVAPPEPFCAPWVREFPTTFFIDAGGRIKLVAEGLVPFFQAQAILKARE